MSYSVPLWTRGSPKAVLDTGTLVSIDRVIVAQLRVLQRQGCPCGALVAKADIVLTSK